MIIHLLESEVNEDYFWGALEVKYFFFLIEYK